MRMAGRDGESAVTRKVLTGHKVGAVKAHATKPFHRKLPERVNDHVGPVHIWSGSYLVRLTSGQGASCDPFSDGRNSIAAKRILPVARTSASTSSTLA